MSVIMPWPVCIFMLVLFSFLHYTGETGEKIHTNFIFLSSRSRLAVIEGGGKKVGGAAVFYLASGTEFVDR